MATQSEADSKPMYAVNLEHLLWENADSEEEAVDKARKELAEMDYDDLLELDMAVVDKDEF